MGSCTKEEIDCVNATAAASQATGSSPLTAATQASPAPAAADRLHEREPEGLRVVEREERAADRREPRTARAHGR